MKKSLVALFSVLMVISHVSVVPAGAAQSYESLTYLYAGNTSVYTNHVDRTGGSLTVVCPDYYEIDAGGRLKLTRTVDPLFLAGMRSRGIRVTPFLSNHWDRQKGRSALANREALTDDLAAQVKEHGLDGLDIDIENITEADRENFTDFIRLLRGKLPQGKVLSVCVAANPYSWTIGWQGSYDYTALAQYVDHIFIMTYDESYQGGSAGPVASYAFIEKSIQYALKYVPPEKIMMGVPFYGRYWQAGEAAGGKALTVSDIERLLERYPSRLWCDAAAHCARATMTLSEKDVSDGLWGGKKLTAGVYDIWHENADSYRDKLSLVRKYNIKGVGSWALGQEPAWLWDSWLLWLNGLPFSDIEGHWAQSYIADLYIEGFVEGVTPNSFGPDRTLTRAQAVVILCRLLGLSETPNATDAFSDVNGHWARGFILSAAQHKIAQGFGDGSFRPDRPLTRQEMAVFLDRLLQLPQTVDFSQHVFGDVSPGLWANNAIVTLSINGVLDGYPDGSFRPGRAVTRGEAAKMFHAVRNLPFKTLAG